MSKVYQIGKHKVRHGDVHNKEEIENFVGNTKAGIYYSDPPWGSGNLKYWDTINRKMNNVETSTNNFDVDVFLDVVLSNAVRYTDGFVVIEYGQRWTDKVIDKGKKLGLIYCGKVETLYGGQNLPLDIIFFHTSDFIELDLSGIEHTKGYTTVKRIFGLLLNQSSLKYRVGMDLCCGMGYTAQACIDNKIAFVGNELNYARLEKTIKRLETDGN